MNDITIFYNPEFGEIRTLEIDGKPYFVARDIAKALGYVSISNAILRHCRCVVKHDIPHPQNKTKTLEVNIIPEDDLYRIITHRELESAEKFKSWIFNEVLPSIRKTGSCETPKAKAYSETLASINNAVKIITPFLVKAGCSEEIQLLTVKSLYEKAGIEMPIDFKAEQKFYTTEHIAREFRMKTIAGKPAIGAVNEIIRKVGYSDKEVEVIYFDNHGHQETTTQYSQSVIDRVAEWLMRNHNPVDIPFVDKSGNFRTYYVVYK